MLQTDAATSRFQGYWPSRSPAPARTRVRGSDEAPEAAPGAPAASSSRTPSGSSCSYGEPASGRQKVTNLRLPGQYDERLFAAAGISGMQGPYYNWNRWYLPSVGRYLELDPIALAGGFNGRLGPDWYGYAMQNPLRWADPYGLMSCVYHVGSHTMTCTSNDGTPQYSNSTYHSGNNFYMGCRDNPACDPIPFVGPIPPGLYRIDFNHWDFNRQTFRRDLIPVGGQPGYANIRNAFQFHYCKNIDAQKCSEGCVTTNKDEFWILNNLLNNEDGDNWLTVTE